jgi:hypothetical protein
MTNDELKDIEEGLKRWHSVSTDTARKLLDEIYRLKHHIGMESLATNILYREREDAYREIERLTGEKIDA